MIYWSVLTGSEMSLKLRGEWQFKEAGTGNMTDHKILLNNNIWFTVVSIWMTEHTEVAAGAAGVKTERKDHRVCCVFQEKSLDLSGRLWHVGLWGFKSAEKSALAATNCRTSKKRHRPTQINNPEQQVDQKLTWGVHAGQP